MPCQSGRNFVRRNGLRPGFSNFAPAPRPLSPDRLPSNMSYHRMRLKWCGATLRALLRRWAVYVVLGLLIVGAGSVGATTAMAAIAAWSVLPLFKAASQSAPLGLLGAMLHALIGAGVVLALRPVLWPVQWAEAERALPVAARERLLSDIGVVLLALLPLNAVYAAGATSWLVPPPAWLHGAEWRAVLMLLLSMALSVLAGVQVLTALRRPPRSARLGRLSSVRAVYRTQGAQPIWRVLLLWPLTRGPARRAGRWLVGLTFSLLATDAAMAAVHGQWAGAGGASWCLAAWGLVSLAGTSRLYALVQCELAPLHEACSHLPISARRLLGARRLLALSPLLTGLALMPLAWWCSGAIARPAVAAAYLLVSLGGHAWQLMGQRPQASEAEQAQRQVVRWLFTLVLLTALASEVFT